MTAAAKTVKPENYTAEQTAKLVEAYKAVRESSQAERDEVVNQFAELFGKTARSIRAKLTIEKVYVAKTYTTKTGGKPVDKEELADAIGKFIPELSEPEITSLAKANKTALDKILRVLLNSKPIGD